MQTIHEDTKRLKALLEGLEPEHMPELLTKSPEYFYRLGQEIAYYVEFAIEVKKEQPKGDQST